MARKNKVGMSLLAISLSSISFLAYADLTLVNNSNRDSTAIINNNGCSSDLPGGITRAKSTNKINDVLISLACRGHLSNCKADVYMTVNCNRSGASRIATVMFDTKKGIKSVSMNSTEYKITGSGFTIRLDGGPAPL